MDYSHFDRIVKEEEEAEKRKQEEERENRRRKYFLEQEAKKKKWLEEHPEHEHDPAHTHSRCGCGFADPEALKRMSENKPPEIPLEEKNAKKMRAVEATREHGKILFSEGKYEHAYAVYERGVLIVNGTLGLSDEDQDVMNQHELMLELNLAACKLKLEDYPGAINHCKMALNLDSKAVKAHYRMAKAHIAMGNYAEATESLDTAKELDPDNTAVDQLYAQIKRLKQRDREKAREYHKKMAQHMQMNKAS